MTEITDMNVPQQQDKKRNAFSVFYRQASRKPGYLIDPVAFFIALFLGPLFVTAASFWLLFIPVFALVVGGPIYLVLGTPLLLIHLRRNAANANDIAMLGMVSVLALFPAACIASLVMGDPAWVQVAAIFLGFGLIFAPLWAGTFGWIYLKLCRDFYAVARPD